MVMISCSTTDLLDESVHRDMWIVLKLLEFSYGILLYIASWYTVAMRVQYYNPMQFIINWK